MVTVLSERSVAAPVARPRWEPVYAAGLVGCDGVAITLAAVVALFVRFGEGLTARSSGVAYGVISVLFPPVWVLVMAMNRAYEARFLGNGSEEFRRVSRASITFIAVVTSFCYAAKVDLARGYVAIALPLGMVLTLLGRYLARKALHRRRRLGRWSHRAIVVGDRTHVADLITQVRREPYAGFQVVGACVPGGDDPIRMVHGSVPVVGSLTTVVQAVQAAAADTVAIAASPGVTGATLRRLAWELEGLGIDLLVAPALTDVAGPRISIRPVAGLPLLHVEEPELTGARRVLKEVFDRSCALIGLVLLLPFLVGVGAAVRLTSPGPALFRQWRVGQHGRAFCVNKFRSMWVDAEEQRAALLDQNESADGALFKIRQDPRVTPIGRWLRRYSIDELPQLWNVVKGDMALVGPRPPLPAEVEQYGSDMRRRLLVKPGITGLWQISGRADLAWDETVRLDLYYVENWSLALDLLILWKTVAAVGRGAGAY